MSYYFESLSNGFNFSGRARRKEFWAINVINSVITLILSIAATAALNKANTMEDGSGIRIMIFFFSLFWIGLILLPIIAASIRRIHDTGHTGWWFLLWMIPFVGVFPCLYFGFKNSVPGPNEYGENPKGDNTIHEKKDGLIKAVSNTATTLLPSKNLEISETESKFYEQVWDEINENKINKGIWAKCFAISKGDEKKTKAMYINQRVDFLKKTTTTNTEETKKT